MTENTDSFSIGQLGHRARQLVLGQQGLAI